MEQANGTRTSDGKGKRGLSCLQLSFIALALTVVGYLCLPFVLCHERERDRRAACSCNLDQIGKAFEGYLGDYGEFPYDPRGGLYSLALLYPKYTEFPNVFVCRSVHQDDNPVFPAGCSLAGKPCSYVYAQGITMAKLRRGGHRPTAGDRWTNHGGEGANVLYTNYDTRWLTPEYLYEEVMGIKHPLIHVDGRN